MRALPLDIGILHFVGIGGIGMSGIAEILHNLGYRVQASDASDSVQCEDVSGTLGITVEIGHKAENLGQAEVIVVSSAIKPENPEVVAGASRFLPVVRRARDAGRAGCASNVGRDRGTHGKTTTTSLVGPAGGRRRPRSD